MYLAVDITIFYVVDIYVQLMQPFHLLLLFIKEGFMLFQASERVVAYHIVMRFIVHMTKC